MKFFETIKNTCRFSLYNPIYVLMCGFVTFFTWMTGNGLLGMTILMLIACVVLIINEDIMPVLPCLMYVIFTTSDENTLNQQNTWPTMIVLAILLVGSFISHLISYPIKFKNHKLTLPFVAISIALFMGGIGFLNKTQYLNGIIFILTLGPCMLAIYYLIMSYTRPPEGVDPKKYICYIVICLGLVILAQMATHYIRADKPIWELLRYDPVKLGWGLSNTIATLLLVIAPTCFYMAYSNKYFAWLYYSLALIFYAAICIVVCRSGIIAGALSLLALLIYTFAKGANRSQLVFVLCSFAIVISAFVLVKMDIVLKVFEHFSNLIFTTSGRAKLYDEALFNFLNHPMFGVGLGYIGNNLSVPDFGIYWYHSTLMQIIGSLGIVGIIAYAYFYFARAKIMFKNLKRFNIVISIGLIAFEIISMMDVGTFIPFPDMLIVIVLTAMLEKNNEKESITFMKSINMQGLM